MRRARIIPLLDLLTVIELERKDILRLNAKYLAWLSWRAARKGPSPAWRLGREFRRNWMRATLVLLLHVLTWAMIVGGFLLWAKASAPAPGAPPSLGRRLGQSLVMLSIVGLLAFAMRSLPLGASYMIWTGIGAVGAFLVGIVILGEPANLPRIAAAVLIVSGLALMKFSHTA